MMTNKTKQTTGRGDQAGGCGSWDVVWSAPLGGAFGALQICRFQGNRHRHEGVQSGAKRRTPHFGIAKRWRGGLLGLVLAGCLTGAWAEPSVTVAIDPPRIPLGRAARLSVTVDGAGQVRMTLPEVEHLAFAKIGHQSSFQIVNGNASYRTTYFFQVTPYREGAFEIPSFRVETDEGDLATDAVSLVVTSGTAPSPAPQATPPQVHPVPTPNQMLGLPNPAPPPRALPVQPPMPPAPPPLSSPGEEGVSNPSGQPYFMRLMAPRQDAYVGETIPVVVKLYVSSGTQAELLDRAPKFEAGDAFTVSEVEGSLSNPPAVIDGHNYKVGIWKANLTPVKPGKFDIAASIPLRVLVRTRDSGFFFGLGGYQQRVVEATTGAENWHVKELPEEGRPAHFSGAIGDFEVTATASPDKVEVGEPITLEMKVVGAGNFDRFDAPQLATTDGWRAYPPTSKVEWKPGTNQGEKTFEQALIPRKDGLEGLPDLTFNFFNPATGKYETRTVTAPKVTILDAPRSSKKAVAANAEEAAEAADADSGMVPIEVRLTPFVAGFAPVYEQPWFAAANSVPLALLVLGYLVARRQQRLESDPEFARSVRASREAASELDRMRAAVRSQDAVAFFTAARRAVQQKAAERWKLRPEDVTAEVIAARKPELAEAAAQLYAAADEVMYSGYSTTGVPLEEWLKSVSQQLRVIGKG